LPFETVGSGEKGCVRLSGSEDFLSFRREPFDPDSKSIPGILDSEILSPRDFLFDYIHMGFRMTRGLFRDSFLKIFTASPEKLIPDTLQKYNHRILFDEKFIALNDEGRRFLNSFLIDCMTELDRSGWNGPICWPLGDI
jgi:hypothetical protein